MLLPRRFAVMYVPLHEVGAHAATTSTSDRSAWVQARRVYEADPAVPYRPSPVSHAVRALAVAKCPSARVAGDRLG